MCVSVCVCLCGCACHTEVSLLTTSIECSDMGMLRRAAKYL